MELVFDAKGAVYYNKLASIVLDLYLYHMLEDIKIYTIEIYL